MTCKPEETNARRCATHEHPLYPEGYCVVGKLENVRTCEACATDPKQCPKHGSQAVRKATPDEQAERALRKETEPEFLSFDRVKVALGLDLFHEVKDVIEEIDDAREMLYDIAKSLGCTEGGRDGSLVSDIECVRQLVQKKASDSVSTGDRYQRREAPAGASDAPCFICKTPTTLRLPNAADGWAPICSDKCEEAFANPRPSEAKPEPVPMVLHCPECRTRHIDEGDFAPKVHHTHSCQSCGLTWRPSVVPTVGVRFLPGFKSEEPRTNEASPVDVDQAYRVAWREGAEDAIDAICEPGISDRSQCVDRIEEMLNGKPPVTDERTLVKMARAQRPDNARPPKHGGLCPEKMGRGPCAGCLPPNWGEPTLNCPACNVGMEYIGKNRWRCNALECVTTTIIQSGLGKVHPESHPESPDAIRPKRINFRCSKCGVAEQSGELPPLSSSALQFYPLPEGWALVPCPVLEEDDHLHCAVCTAAEHAPSPAALSTPSPAQAAVEEGTYWVNRIDEVKAECQKIYSAEIHRRSAFNAGGSCPLCGWESDECNCVRSHVMTRKEVTS